MSNESMSMIESVENKSYDDFFESFDSFVQRVATNMVIGEEKDDDEYDDEEEDNKEDDK